MLGLKNINYSLRDAKLYISTEKQSLLYIFMLKILNSRKLES